MKRNIMVNKIGVLKINMLFLSTSKMSLNPQALSTSISDVLEGTVTSFFNRQENSLLQNELINGQYRMITASCYGGNTPVKSPGFTHICISTNGSTIADLDNTFINANLEYTLKFDKDLQGKGGTVFIGFKQSLEALSRYDIIVNSTKVYTQSFVGPESTILNAGINDLIRRTNPYVYTTWENAFNKDNNVCGIYLRMDEEYEANTEFKVEIPIKINMHQFLILSGIKYLPAFAGRWEIELYFDSRNIVICNCNPGIVNHTKLIPKTADYIVDNLTYDFKQIGEPINMTDGFADDAYLVVENVKLSCTDCIAKEVYVNITQFQLRYEVYEALQAHYSEKPWIIPTNILQYARFSGQPADWLSGQAYHCTLSQSLENCDSVFILIPQSTNQQTCYYNPYLDNVRMSLGEFGIHPGRYVNTHDDPRFLNMFLDSLNLSESNVSSMNKDVARSILGTMKHYKLNPTEPSIKVKEHRIETLGDKSNFFIGISLSNNGFQNGCVNSPNTSIPFLFDAEFNKKLVQKYWCLDAGGDLNNNNNYPSINSSIICLFLIDAAIMIQVIPGSDIPGVKLTTKSIV